MDESRKNRILHNTFLMLESPSRAAKFHFIKSEYKTPNDYASKQCNYTPTMKEDEKLAKMAKKHPEVVAVGNILNSKCRTTRSRFYIVWDEADEVLGIKILRAKADLAAKPFKATHMILVLKHAITQQSVATLAEEYPQLQVEVWLHDEQFIIPTKHKTNPQWLLTTTAEVKKDIVDLKRLDQLPKLQWSNIIRRYYDFPMGAPIKIIRSSRTAGIYITYRVVVEDPVR